MSGYVLQMMETRSGGDLHGYRRVSRVRATGPLQVCWSDLRYWPHAPGGGYVSLSEGTSALADLFSSRDGWNAHLESTAAAGWVVAAVEGGVAAGVAGAAG